SRRRHTRSKRDWSSDVCSSDLNDYDPSSRAFVKSIMSKLFELALNYLRLTQCASMRMKNYSNYLKKTQHQKNAFMLWHILTILVKLRNKLEKPFKHFMMQA